MGRWDMKAKEILQRFIESPMNVEAILINTDRRASSLGLIDRGARRWNHSTKKVRGSRRSKRLYREQAAFISQ